nr:efflux RND transporter permease subunit [Candidatus Wallbacteria bacterium]
RVEPTSDTMDRLRARLSGIAGVNLLLAEGQHGPPTGPPINIEISGDNFAVLGMIAEKVKEVLKTVPHVKDIEDDYVKGTPNFEFVVDRKKAGLYGLTVGSIGSVIKTAINGWKVSTYREGNDSYDIVIKMKNAYRQDIDFFKKLFIPTMQYGLVPLADLITVNYTGGFGSINRINNQRVVTVKAKVDTNKIPGAVARAIVEKVLKRYELPAGYSVKFTGENQEQDEAQSFLSEAFAIALGLIFFVLVMQFNSVSHTLIIMTSVLLSFGGVFLGLGISNIPFGIIMTGIGVISLAGVVVNNAIVLLDYTNQLIERGYELTDAVVFAGQTRFRPVLLTAVTTILGLIPMITGISYDFKRMKLLTSSESTFWWYSMAVVVAYGLAFATFLTLVVVPVIYHLIEDGKSRIKKLFS